MTASWLDMLLSPAGSALLTRFSQENLEASTELSLITRLRKEYPAELVSAAVEQTKLRRRARAKFSRADEMFFTRAGLEQASTERMAMHHVGRYAEFNEMADLCSGIGGDLIALSNGRRVTAVDIDPLHSRIGAYNAAVYGNGSNVRAVVADVTEVGLPRAVFVDPARRSDDRRFAVGQSDPPLDWCFALAGRGIATGIKAAPGLPHDLVPDGWEIEFVSERRELKECVLWSPQLRTAERRATLLPSGDMIVARDGASLDVKDPGRFLLDPDPAITRAAVVEELGEQLGNCWKIDDRVAFLSSDTAFNTPFGRNLTIEASMPWSLNRLKDTLRALDVGSIDIRKRGSAVDVEEIQRRLKPKGSRPATVVLTRVANQPWAFVCI